MGIGIYEQARRFLRENGHSEESARLMADRLTQSEVVGLLDKRTALRDAFAKAALQSMLLRDPSCAVGPHLAESAYMVADMMMAERAKPAATKEQEHE